MTASNNTTTCHHCGGLRGPEVRGGFHSCILELKEQLSLAKHQVAVLTDKLLPLETGGTDALPDLQEDRRQGQTELPDLRTGHPGGKEGAEATESVQITIELVISVLASLAEECGDIVASKGFDQSLHRTQIAMIAVEVAECLEHVTPSGNKTMDYYVHSFVGHSERIEAYRRRTTTHTDTSAITNEADLYIELADVVLKVFSYAGGNGKARLLAESIWRKKEIVRGREHKNGKGF